MSLPFIHKKRKVNITRLYSLKKRSKLRKKKLIRSVYFSIQIFLDLVTQVSPQHLTA